MRPKAEWAIDSEAIWARGIIFKYCITKQQIDNEVYKMSGQQSCHIYYRASHDKSKLREGGGGGGEGYHYFLWQESLCRDRYAVNSSHI